MEGSELEEAKLKTAKWEVITRRLAFVTRLGSSKCTTGNTHSRRHSKLQTHAKADKVGGHGVEARATRLKWLKVLVTSLEVITASQHTKGNAQVGGHH